MRSADLLRIENKNINLKERYFVTGSKTEAGMNRQIPIHHLIFPIIKKFISDLEIPSEDYSKYYILYDDDLKKLDLEIRNADNSLYVVNYDTGEVYITKAYKGKYRLSEIDK